jgi:methyl-accepting chemotaxis protein
VLSSALRLDRLTVAQRILAGFGVVLLLLLASAALTFRGVGAVNGAIENANTRVEAAERAGRFDRLLNATRRLVLNYTRTEQGEMLAELKAGVAGLAEAGKTQPEARAQVEAYVAGTERLIAAIQARKTAQAALAKHGAALSNAGYAMATTASAAPALAAAAFRADRALQSALAAIHLFRGSANPADAGTARMEFLRYGRELEALARLDAAATLRAPLAAIQGRLPAFTAALDGVLDGAGTIDAAFQALRQTGDGLVAASTTAREASLAEQRRIMAAMTADAHDLQRNVALVGLLALLVGGVLAWRVGRGVARPVTALTGAMGRLASGDTEAAVPGAERRDEIGAMARAVQVFKDALIAKRAADAAAATEAAAKAERAARLDALAQGFEANVSVLTQGLAGAATEMEATARAMAGTADETERQSGTAMRAAEETSANVQTVAAASEEMSASIREIAGQAGQSARIARQASEEAQRTDGLVRQLAASAERIDTVVALINTIAGQTNLLALNATIEAARAGEAGRGFAVVAGEVKDLAGQTTRATGEIAGQIGAIQDASRQSVEAIRTIGATIAEMAAASNAIAAAMEQQGAATHEIARTVQQAASGTGEVAQSIADVRGGAGSTGAAAAQVLAAAQELSRHSESLRREVGGFLEGVKAA